MCPAFSRSSFLGIAGLIVALGSLSAAPVVVPRYTHPSAGQTLYFLLTDRFANGSPANDRGGLEGGPEVTGFDPTRISHFHGGDFVGLTSRLDYLKQLGITAVWVTPPFKNKPVQAGTAGYHGYWTLDFLSVDPHLGTNDEYHEFIRQAHARGLRVYMDIVVNHTADVIDLQGDRSYKDLAHAPYRDAGGQPFDERLVAYNGLTDQVTFPALSAAKSFPYVPIVSVAESQAKNPAWLNDLTMYHNRGNSTFVGENSVQGDFAGLDDLFTERPEVVKGFIDVFSWWMQEFRVDGFRIDTVRHVNAEFWSAFAPAIRARARELGRSDFIQFGEVYNDAGDASVLSEYSTGTVPLDTTLDFGFFAAARKYVSRGGSAKALREFFDRDDYYTDHDSNVHSTTTFLGNHDAGRFGYFLQQDNRGASAALLTDLVKFGHGLLYLSRGQPVVYYGDEQGMVGRGGNDMQARESMFGSHAPDFRDAALLGTTRTGVDGKFDEHHPIYDLLRRLGNLRREHAALRTGAMIPRETSRPDLFAFSRIERTERIEYVAVFNNSRTEPLSGALPTAQAPGSGFVCIFDSQRTDADLGNLKSENADGKGALVVTVAPLQFAVWRATKPLNSPTTLPRISISNVAPNAVWDFRNHDVDGQSFANRQEIRADVSGGDGVAEVTFAMRRASRPDQLEYLGTDDAPPYRIFWRPPSDLNPSDKLTFVASVTDLRGHADSTDVTGISVAPDSVACGIRGATVPRLLVNPASAVDLVRGRSVQLKVVAEGTGPLEYQWIRDGAELPGATNAELAATVPGSYSVLVRNLAGTAISGESRVSLVATETNGK